MAKKPAKQATKRTRQSPARHPNVVAWFETKLEAEWGPYDLKHALDENPESVVVLDTRDRESFQEERLPHAINIPGQELKGRLTSCPKTRRSCPTVGRSPAIWPPAPLCF